jgi:uncharacterized protein
LSALRDTFLTAEWRDLVMLNFEIDAGAITDLAPSGTELDNWNGTTFISLVGFRFLNTRVLGVGIPFHKDFSEVNLRFYVRRKTEGAWRRGVVFIKEIVPRRAIAWMARSVYNENYVALPMRHEMLRPVATSSPGRATYEWRYEGQWQQLSLRFSLSPFMPAEDSLESFITEHYWGYARQRDGGTVQYHVEHPRWPVWRADEATFEGEAAGLYGPRFAPFLAAPPASAFIAEGSPVTVRRGTRVLR